MGAILSNRALTANEILRAPSPTVLCIDRPDIDKAIIETGYQTVRLNLPLARSLKGLPENSIRSSINGKIYKALPQATPLYLTDYEMLFDPRYNLDVIKLFTYISRQNKLIVKWCGTIDRDLLIYAEPGYDDYRSYKVSDYDITVIC